MFEGPQMCFSHSGTPARLGRPGPTCFSCPAPWLCSSLSPGLLSPLSDHLSALVSPAHSLLFSPQLPASLPSPSPHQGLGCPLLASFPLRLSLFLPCAISETLHPTMSLPFNVFSIPFCPSLWVESEESQARLPSQHPGAPSPLGTCTASAHWNVLC